MRYLLLLLMALAPVGHAQAQQLSLIPYPDQVELGSGTCSLPANVEFTTAQAGLRPLLAYINTSLHQGRAGAKQPVTLSIAGNKSLRESYRLAVTGKGIRIDAPDTAGLFYGLVTLLQLCKTTMDARGRSVLPQVVIKDAPRYAWRGFMLDESRHFFGKAAVELLLDWMAFYKLNRFHWHLTDAQGWRIAIEQYPLLTSVGGRGNFTDTTAPANIIPNRISGIL
ncbi:MAG TPA: family 20 glycosylhydrolase [Chitinophaga sp.]